MIFDIIGIFTVVAIIGITIFLADKYL